MSVRRGWVAGDIMAGLRDPGRGQWLTVRGSALGMPWLFETRDEAVMSEQSGACVAYVEERLAPSGLGWVYRIDPGSLVARDGKVPLDYDGQPV